MPNRIIEIPANRLKKAMELRGVNQIKLCRLTGIPKSTISDYVRNASLPKQLNLMKIGEALLVDEGWLMGLDVPMERVDSQVELLNKYNNLTSEQKEIIKNMITQFTLLNNLNK